MRLWMSLVVFLATMAVAPAHGHSDHEKHEALKHESVERLEHFLEHEAARRLRVDAVGLNLIEADDATAKLAGEKLLEAVHDEVVLALKASGPPTLAQKSRELVVGVIKRFNPIALGRWVLQASRIHGPTLAVAYGVSEVAEQIGLLMTFKYPAMAFLVPIYVFHVSDVVVIGSFFAVPKIKAAFSRWKRHGGWWSGARGYYEHLVEQRRALPIDWSIVLHAPQFEDVRFAVIEEGRVERKLWRSLRIMFDPRALAQRQAAPTLGLWEIERIAQVNGVAMFAYKPFKNDARMYARLLLREIMLRPGARAELGAAVRKSLAQVKLDKPKQAATSPSIVAEQWRWHLRARRDLVKEAAAAQSAGISRAQQKIFRELSKVLDGDKGLARLASTRFSEPTAGDWGHVDEAVAYTQALLQRIESQLLSLDSCERLLKDK